jgi:hypothetical protein
LIANARKKLHEKNLDMVVANNVAKTAAVLTATLTSRPLSIGTGAARSLPLMSKDDLADCIYDHYLALKKPALKWELQRAQSGEVLRRAALIQPGASVQVENDLVGILGEIDRKSEALSWAASKYYESEMGPGLLRRFLSFSTLASPENLPPSSCKPRRFEERYRAPVSGGRQIKPRSGIPRLLQSCSGLD